MNRQSVCTTVPTSIRRLLTILLLVIGLTAAPGCQSTSKPPLTEKDVRPGSSSREKGLMVLSDHRVLQMSQSGMLLRDGATTRYIERVAGRVLPERVREKMPFSFFVLRHPVPNAFAMPNGAIFLHTGLISRLQNEAQLAMILAHETVHVIERHSLEHMASVENKLGTLRWLGLVAASAGRAGNLAYRLGRLFTIAAVFGFSRDLEREADRTGFEYLVEAGYDPDQAPEVFRLLNLQLDKEREQPPYLYATHPRNRERRKYLRERAEGVQRTKTMKKTERFLKRTRSIRLRNARANINRYWPRTARYELDLVLRRTPDHPEAHLFKARTYFFTDEPEEERAIRLTRKAIENGLRTADSYLFLARVQMKTGQFSAARRNLETVLDQHPNDSRRKMIQKMIRHCRERTSSGMEKND